ncbi:GFA family protein [Paremcibacter congregatus]|uniref:Aldehyde-activating protein n=1 Tax=Paremcibacter congregatus TaxID=2043170 RepID=A0A2G4YWK2_9PROT|nr:GFA family protein [Paremcibacter congregatus]PHZ86643.1 aldehyde-activating protein [Paremcibacter congregatus]QDE26444.1 GFA family protein [Paremcibacter congregatus]
MQHKGSCHCGVVRFTVEAPTDIIARRCNCSICNMTGFIHVIVEKPAFTLINGADNLNLYTFNSHTAQHYFCKTCGVKSFYIPRSHPDGYSINLNCLDKSTFSSITLEDFDGQNWEQNVKDIT